MKTICIVGGGFGGIRTALDCSRILGTNVRTVLITPKPHFEFTPSLYRIVSGKTPRAACIPLRDIFSRTPVEICTDSIESVDLKNQTAYGKSGSRYAYNYLVLAVGSETSYYNIPGLKDLSFSFKTITEALRLKNHLQEVFSSCSKEAKEQKVCSAHVVIIGGGPSGVEIAAELSEYCTLLARLYGISEHMVTLDLFEGAERILPTFPPRVSKVASARLRSLGINIFTNRQIMKEDVENAYMPDMRVRSKTVIWAAGIVPNALIQSIPDIETSPAGQIIVDDYLRMRKSERVFVIGDSASVPYGGTAQAATNHGKHTARTIVRTILRTPICAYKHRELPYIIPLGSRWAMVSFRKFVFMGFFPWLLRRVADARFFLSILPLRRAYDIFSSEKNLCEECNVCLKESGEP